MILASRKQNRLPKHLYREGGFFVTINVHHHEKVFGEVVGEEMVVNEYGKIVRECWFWLGDQYPYICLGDFVIMPNHIHGILYIENVGDVRERPLQPKPKGLSSLIAAFKTVSAKNIHKLGLSSFQRQRSFYDHIIRNEEDLLRIQEYIELNPYKRENDEYYVK